MQILSWMESLRGYQASARDLAAKLDLMIKVNGIASAERQFERISDHKMKKAAFLPLLQSYVKERNLEKAQGLLAKLDNLTFILSPHPFNEIMKLYAATGQFIDVIYVIRHMKRSKIPLNLLSYNLWMSACGALSDINSLDLVHIEMIQDKTVEVNWSAYCTLANIYISNYLSEKAFTALRIAETKVSTKKRQGLFYIMTNYAALGDKDGVLRLWECCKRAEGKLRCSNYMSVMSCLIKVGDILAAERVLMEYESKCWKYDIRVCNILLGAYMRNGNMEKVQFLFYHALKKGASLNFKTWEILMEGWAKRREMDRVVEAMMKCLSLLEGCIWRPSDEILMAVAEFYEERRRVDDGERYVSILRRYQLMNLELYKSFVRMYIRAKVEPNSNIMMMMAADGVEADEEIRKLVRLTVKDSWL